MRDSRHVAVRRTVRHGAAGLLCALLAAAAWGQDPWGDYGDAPDSPLQHFPTMYMTANSRLGGPGVHHLSIGQEMLGVGVSGELGATDPLDPDGIPNLVDHDGFDDGLVMLYVISYGSPFGQGMTTFYLEFDVTIAPGAPDVPRYLNVLIDGDRDQEWRNRGGSREWVVINWPVQIPPGTTHRFIVPAGRHLDPFSNQAPPADLWMRMTLTRVQIDPLTTLPLGGWDGSGAFEFGETEDYRLFYSAAPGQPGNTPGVPVSKNPPPGSGCWFDADCEKDIVSLDHCGPPGLVRAIVTMRGACAGCTVTSQPITYNDPDDIDWIGPLFGINITNGPTPANIGASGSGPGPGPNQFQSWVWINPVCDPPERTQSFGIRFHFQGFDPAGGLAWSAVHTCDVVIYHSDEIQTAMLSFSQGAYPAGEPIAVESASGEALAYVTFGNDQPTAGTVSVTRVGNWEGMQSDPSLLPVASFIDLDFEPPGEEWWPGTEPAVQTEIVGLTLTGYTDPMLLDKGILNENILEPIKMPYYVDSFFDVFTELTPDVGEFWLLDPAANTITINHPYGFSIWGFRANYPLGDMNCDGVVNNQDIDGFVLALFNATGYAVRYPNCNILNGDFTGDGHVNNQDIDGFVAALFGH